LGYHEIGVIVEVPPGVGDLLYGWVDWSTEPVTFGSFRKLDGWGVIGAIEDSMVVVSELFA